MKISVNDQVLFELNEIQMKVFANQIPNEILEDDLKRRLQWILMHKYEECFRELENEWKQKFIAEGAKSLPTDKDEFATLVFAHPEYKDRSTREALANEAVK